MADVPGGLSQELQNALSDPTNKALILQMLGLPTTSAVDSASDTPTQPMPATATPTLDAMATSQGVLDNAPYMAYEAQPFNAPVIAGVPTVKTVNLEDAPAQPALTGAQQALYNDANLRARVGGALAANPGSLIAFTSNGAQYQIDQAGYDALPSAPAKRVTALAHITSDGVVKAGDTDTTGLLGYFDHKGLLHLGDKPLDMGGPDQWDAQGRLISHDAFTSPR